MSRLSEDILNSTPTHSDEVEIIMRALTAAKLAKQGKQPPDERWKLTDELLDNAFRACLEIMQCRKRTLFIR